VSLLAVLVALAGLAATAHGTAGRAALTVRTSLGSIEPDDTRALRARGVAPRGSTLVVRFYRGRSLVATKHPRVRRGRYRASRSIDRTGAYVVRVAARTAGGETLRATATLDYGPRAKAPSAPTPAPDPSP
jgi:hypothetical protein